LHLNGSILEVNELGGHVQVIDRPSRWPRGSAYRHRLGLAALVLAWPDRNVIVRLMPAPLRWCFEFPPG
jgi:hypothetical protein